MEFTVGAHYAHDNVAIIMHSVHYNGNIHQVSVQFLVLVIYKSIIIWNTKKYS